MVKKKELTLEQKEVLDNVLVLSEDEKEVEIEEEEDIFETTTILEKEDEFHFVKPSIRLLNKIKKIEEGTSFKYKIEACFYGKHDKRFFSNSPKEVMEWINKIMHNKDVDDEMVKEDTSINYFSFSISNNKGEDKKLKTMVYNMCRKIKEFHEDTWIDNKFIIVYQKVD